jgi:hypothetical protein
MILLFAGREEFSCVFVIESTKKSILCDLSMLDIDKHYSNRMNLIILCSNATNDVIHYFEYFDGLINEIIRNGETRKYCTHEGYLT